MGKECSRSCIIDGMLDSSRAVVSYLGDYYCVTSSTRFKVTSPRSRASCGMRSQAAGYQAVRTAPSRSGCDCYSNETLHRCAVVVLKSCCSFLVWIKTERLQPNIVSRWHRSLRLPRPRQQLDRCWRRERNSVGYSSDIFE